MMNKERELLRWIYDDLERDTKLPLWLRDRVRDFLASKPESDGPVAWTSQNELNALGTDVTCSMYSERMIGENNIPLYTRPAEQEGKPIPIDQIDKAYENTLYLDGYFAFGAGVRFAERHHGIKEEL